MTEQKRHQGWGAIDELSPGEARVRVKALEAKLADLQQRAPWIPSTEQLASALESVPFYDHKSPELIAPDMRAALVTRMQSDAWDTWQVQGGHGWVITSCGNGDIIVSHESHGSASIAPNPTIPRIIPEALLRALSESLLAGERPTLIGVDLAASEAPAQPQAAPAPNPTPMVTTEMKQKFIGEFSWEEEAPYYDENGVLHDHVAQHVVPWDLCKRIYKELAGFALTNGVLAPPVASAAPDAALLAEALEKARETISVSLKTGAPDWFKSDNDVSTHLTVKKIDAALAAYRCSTMSPAASAVLAERQRQISAEGWTPEHDDEYDPGTLAAAAAAYTLHAADHLNPYSQGDGGDEVPVMWPWVPASTWKPATPRRDLVKAGALIIAEIERIDRAAHQSGGAES